MPDRADVERFLTELHGAPVRDVAALTGGFWSRAFGYRSGDDELVARFGDNREWFEADRDAMAYSSADLPVPDVLEIGTAFDGVYAISRRAHGRFLEDMGPEVAPALHRLLDALRHVPPTTDPSWSWRQNLLDRFTFDQPPGWRAALAKDRVANALFDRCEVAVRDLIDVVPDRQDLLHGDLLHKNVLVSDDASTINAVFSWKCSVRGDHLYDVAWCTFWGDTFHPGIAAAVDRTLTDDEAMRVRCYELHIGAQHLGWYAWTDAPEDSRIISAHLEKLLAS